jgi:hypothetical protein
MGATSVTPIVLGFVLGIIPFALWTWWLIHQERSASASRVAGSITFTPPGEAVVSTPAAEGVRPRWRREQTAA